MPEDFARPFVEPGQTIGLRSVWVAGRTVAKRRVRWIEHDAYEHPLLDEHKIALFARFQQGFLETAEVWPQLVIRCGMAFCKTFFRDAA